MRPTAEWNYEVFKQLCDENGVEVADLPAFPPRNWTKEQWTSLIVEVGKSKKRAIVDKAFENLAEEVYKMIKKHERMRKFWLFMVYFSGTLFVLSLAKTFFP